MIDITDIDQAQRLYQALSKDSALFAKEIMGHIVTRIPDFHREAYEVIDKNYQYLAFVWGRGLAKSTISHTIQVTKDICHAAEPYIILISETIDQASADLISVQDEIINNELIHQLYGDLKGEIWNVQSMELANGCYVKCLGYGSRVRGAKWKNSRPTKIILDDFESEQNSATPDQREEVQRWINARVMPATEVSSSKYQFWGTIVHPDSFLAKAKNLSFFKHPYGHYQEVPIERNGKPVWPERYPMSWIEFTRKRYEETRQLSLFLQEYYNIPSLTGKPRFNPDMITEIDGVFQREGITTWIKHANGTKTPVYVFIGVDPASSLAETADNTIMTVIGVLPSLGAKKYIILDMFADKLTPTEQRDKLFELVYTYSPKMVTIETQGYQGALEDMCREKMREKGLYFAINSFKSNKSKSNKWLLGLEPVINSGDISRLSGLKNWQLLQNELVCYNENVRAHDDTIDGLFLALQGSYAPQNYDVDEMITKLRHRADTKNKRKRTWFTT